MLKVFLEAYDAESLLFIFVGVPTPLKSPAIDSILIITGVMTVHHSDAGTGKWNEELRWFQNLSSLEFTLLFSHVLSIDNNKQDWKVYRCDRRCIFREAHPGVMSNLNFQQYFFRTLLWCNEETPGLATLIYIFYRIYRLFSLVCCCQWTKHEKIIK